MQITDPTQIQLFYKALLAREKSYVGSFFVGVKTTSVFCIASCRARKPKLKNVEFFTTVKEVLDNGYRPCKICKPTQHADDTPKQVKRAMELVKKNPKEKIADQHLIKHDISPSLVRRWFKKSHGITFQAYQRMLRINTAIEELKAGKQTTATAFDLGYESLSGFGYTYKRVVGASPQKSLSHRLIRISRFTTPLGPMFVCATDQGVCLLEFVDRRMLETEFKELQHLMKAKIIVGENKHIIQCKEEIAEYFEGSRKTFNVRLDTPGTLFQQEVWKNLSRIPFGKVRTYAQQAKAIDQPVSIRSVITANGVNRVAIIIPCHRAVGEDGILTGYGGGVARKKWLLNHESKSFKL